MVENLQDSSKTVGAVDKSAWKCYKCGKEGHIKRDCPSLKNKSKKKIQKAKHLMCEDEEDSSDSGASKHVTEKFFKTISNSQKHSQ